MKPVSPRLLLATGFLLLAGFTAGRVTAPDGESLFQAVLRIVERDAVDSLPPGEAWRRAAQGLVDRLGDPYAELQSAEDFARFSRNALGNSYAGLGIRIVEVRGRLAVWRVMPGGPAAAAGVEPGDRIVAVGDSATAEWNVERASRELTGPVGTPVRVTFARDGSTYRRNFTRAVIHPSSVPFTAVLPGGVGYLPLARFSDHSAADVARALAALERSGARRLVLDLRGNPGGDLEQAAELAGLFLRRGQTVVRVQYRRVADTLRVRHGPLVGPELPVAVLLDSASASASEILAGALQDYDRAVVIGTTSYGKGLVQGVYRLADGWVLRLTTGHWYTPSGRLIQRAGPDSVASPVRPVFRSAAGRPVLGGGGITPDIEVAGAPVPAAEAALARVLNTRAADANRVLDGYAAELEPRLEPGFVIVPAWRAELVRRFRAAGVELPDSLVTGAAPYLDRLLGGRAGLFAETDSTGFLRHAPRDLPLNRAVDLLLRAESQEDLLTLATAAVPQG